MRKSGVAAVLACLTCGFAGSASALSGPKVFSLLDVSRPDVQPINGFTFDRMPRAGDQFPIEDDLYKWAGTKRGALVGHVEGTGTFQVVGDTTARVLFFAQATLPGGTVAVHGYGTITFRGPSKFTFPVIGGTGIYANARGWVEVRDLGNGDGDNSNVAFHLMP